MKDTLSVGTKGSKMIPSLRDNSYSEVHVLGTHRELHMEWRER
jgi:hypothetical protein